MTEKTDGLVKVRDELFETYQKKLDLPVGVIIRAGELLDDTAEAGLTRSRCYRTIIAAVTFMACREENVPRVVEDIANVTHKNGESLSPNKVRQEAQKIKRELKIGLQPTSPSVYLDYYAEQLNTTDETKDVAHELLEIAEENGMDNGPAPTSLAAGTLDAARRITGDDIYQTDISDVSHVSVAQLREHCHKLMDNEHTVA